MENMVDQIMVDQSVIQNYEKRIRELEAKLKISVPMILQFQNYIDTPPITREQMFDKAKSNDEKTMSVWHDTWIKNLKENRESFDFEMNSSLLLHGSSALRPVICAGSGPSLKKNINVLANEKPDGISIVSCLHNFAFFVDKGIKDVSFITLDAGAITLDEVSQGGKNPPEFYWDATQNYTLVSALVAYPPLLKKWKGKILWFDAPTPSPAYTEERNKVTDFSLYYNVGGNALGACYYHARAVLGGMPIVFIGADFSFDYTHKFHSWDSPYDQQFSGIIPCTDIFGNRVYTWPSYYNFSQWFNSQSMGGQGKNPVLMINCSEGGILGAYPQGNIRSIQQMALSDFFVIYSHYKKLPEMVNPDPTKPKLLF